MLTVDELSNIIRAVDGRHTLGAGALAEALLPAIVAAMVPAEIRAMGDRLRADRRKNDHWTAYPIFTVQRESRVYHLIDGEGDGFIWTVDSEECDAALSARLERRRIRGWELPERYERIAYRTTWDFEDAFLTYEGAKARVAAKQHAKLRTYVESGYRNAEWKAMQAFLLSLPPEADAAVPASPAPKVWPRSYQDRVGDWMLACFGETIALDGDERNHRFLEEALELVQSLGCTAAEAHQLVDYVFGRPIGEPKQESGGVSVTHAALCGAHGIRMNEAAETELARVWTKVEAIRAKQAAKPKFGPLPGVAAEAQAS